MSFGLLAPAALGLAMLLLGPLLAHLARRQPRRVLPFGAMLLLRRLVRRLRRRRRVHDLILLLLRLLAVALAVAAVARPELSWPDVDTDLVGARTVVIVLDNSLSMDLRDGAGEGGDPETLLTRGRRQAVEMVRSLSDGARVGLVTIGGDATTVTPKMTDDRGAVIVAIDQVRQTWGRTDLSGGLQAARRLLAGKGGAVVVFTDEAGPENLEAARAELSLLIEQGASFVPMPVRAADPANFSVVDARYGEGLEGGSVRVTVSNYGPRDAEVPLVVRLPDGAEITAFVDVPAGELAEESVTVPRVAEGGVGIAEVRDERLTLDNALAFQLPRVGASRVLVIDGDPGPTPVASEVYFLERALAPWGASAAQLGGVLPDVTATAGVTDLDPEVHRVVFLANVSDPGSLSARLVDFVRRGGGLVIGMGDNVTAELYNGPLALLLPGPLRRPRSLVATGEDGVDLELPDVSTDLFKPFARGGRSAFGRAAFRRVFTLEPYQDSDQVRTLLRLEGGIPVLVERRLGQGRVLLYTGTFDLGWTDFPLQAIYMPWVQRLVSYLGGEAGGGGERLKGRVGDTINVPLPDAGLDVSVTGPAGPAAAPVRSGAVSFLADRPGAWLVETPGAPPLAWVAVNTDPRESDVRRGPSMVTTAAEVDPERFLRHLGLGPCLLGAALLVALLQGVLSLLGRGRGEHDEADTLAEGSKVHHAGQA